MLVKFFIALGMTVVVLAGASLLWPRFTDRPMPPFLGELKSKILSTSSGTNVANVLGVSDDRTMEPIHVATIAQSAAEGVRKSVEMRMQDIIFRQALNQILKQYDSLAPEQRDQVQQSICPIPEE